MKKSIIFIVAILFSGMLVWNYNKNTTNFTTKVQAKESNQLASQQSIAKKIIRFHVLANSDSLEDQALKLKVRDKVLEYIAPKMAECKTINESKKVLMQNNDNIRKIAQDVVFQKGYTYSVKTELSKVQFPVKEYGTIILPEGEYEAYRILIGSANGHNWWCVMFPPLCFTDITKGDVEVKKTQEEMKQALTKEEYELVDNSKNISDSKKIVVKFKIVEEAEKLIDDIKKKLSHK